MGGATVCPKMELSSDVGKQSGTDEAKDGGTTATHGDNDAVVPSYDAIDKGVVAKFSKWALADWDGEPHSFGGAEGRAILVQMLNMDTNGNGEVCADEEGVLAEKLTGDYNNLLVNTGVIGALTLSIVLPIFIDAGETSESSIKFFGDTGVEIIENTFYALSALVLGASLALIHLSVRMYTHLSFWMPRASDKLWYIKEISLVPVIVAASRTILFIAISAPFGAATFVSPLGGLFALLLSTGVLLLALRKEKSTADLCHTRIHKSAKEVVENNAAKLQLTESANSPDRGQREAGHRYQHRRQRHQKQASGSQLDAQFDDCHPRPPAKRGTEGGGAGACRGSPQHHRLGSERDLVCA